MKKKSLFTFCMAATSVLFTACDGQQKPVHKLGDQDKVPTPVAVQPSQNHSAPSTGVAESVEHSLSSAESVEHTLTPGGNHFKPSQAPANVFKPSGLGKEQHSISFTIPGKSEVIQTTTGPETINHTIGIAFAANDKVEVSAKKNTLTVTYEGNSLTFQGVTNLKGFDEEHMRKGIYNNVIFNNGNVTSKGYKINDTDTSLPEVGGFDNLANAINTKAGREVCTSTPKSSSISRPGVKELQKQRAQQKLPGK